jgi:adenosylcobinamide amidohydrolase
MSAIPLLETPFFSLQRSGRHLIARLLQPAQVLSTCPVNGGLHHSVQVLVNHQSCEPVKHQERFELIVGLGQAGYHAHVCGELGLQPGTTAVLGTAATMQYLGLATRSHADLSVTAIVTAGVTGNAGCAGDKAHYDEIEGRWLRVTENPEGKPPGIHGGTINTLLLLSSPLSAAGLARAVMTMTEAKSAALATLAIGSKASWHIATGTGTDQYAVAAPAEGASTRTWTGKHTKAGELIGVAVREATLEALRWQNGLEPSLTRSLVHCLGRFGLSEDRLKAGMERRLTAREYQFFKDNWNPVVHEPQLSAASYAFAAVLERVLAGGLGASSLAEGLLNQATLMAAGLAARPQDFARFRERLAPTLNLPTEAPEDRLIAAALELALDAIALGWQSKWSAET